MRIGLRDMMKYVGSFYFVVETKKPVLDMPIRQLAQVLLNQLRSE